MDKLDILQRDEFVKQLERMIENISENKASTCFALTANGAVAKLLFQIYFKKNQKQNKMMKQLIINILLFVIIVGSMTIIANSCAIVAELMNTY